MTTSRKDEGRAGGGNPRVAMIGAGKMGQTLIGGWLDAGAVDAGSIVATAGMRIESPGWRGTSESKAPSTTGPRSRAPTS